MASHSHNSHNSAANMSERKVSQKYIPPDFDPNLIPKNQKAQRNGPKQIPIRLMAPFSMSCTRCGQFIYKGRKFNARKETTTEAYLDIPIYRFYIRCTGCSDQITFKTDPKHNDYIAESGARRNFEPWREYREEETDEQKLDRLEAETMEEQKDAMQELETKVVDAKAEMAVADAIDELRVRNARRAAFIAQHGPVPLDEDHLVLMNDEELARFASSEYKRKKALLQADIKAGRVKPEIPWDMSTGILPPDSVLPEVAMRVYGAVNYGPGTDTPLSALKPFQKKTPARAPAAPKPPMTRPLTSKPRTTKPAVSQPRQSTLTPSQAQLFAPSFYTPPPNASSVTTPQGVNTQVAQPAPKAAEVKAVQEAQTKLAAPKQPMLSLTEQMAIYASSSEDEDEE